MMLLLFLVSECLVSFDFNLNIVQPAQYISHSSFVQHNMSYLGVFNNCECQESPAIFMVCYGKCTTFPMLTVNVTLFTLKLSQIEVIKKYDFLYLENLEALEIEGNDKLNKIEPGCFKQMNKVMNLTIANNVRLNKLDEDVFEGLINLKTLSLKQNGFKRVLDATRALSPKYVPTIHLLDLSLNIFHSVEKHEFHYMNNTNLQEINIYLCGIYYIHPKSLQPLKNLTYLRIGENLFNKTTITNLVAQIVQDGTPLELLNLLGSGFERNIPYDLLEIISNTTIKDIVLGKNNFVEIKDHSIPYMPNLYTMDLRDCGIEYISDNAFQNLSKIFTLLLNSNKINYVPKSVLLPNLDILDLAENSNENLFLIPEKIFENMSHLEDLYVCYNNIQFITNLTFFGLKGLLFLSLKASQLIHIQEGAFMHTPNLKRLNLGGNPKLGSSLTSETFKGLSNLTCLLLGECGIQNVTSQPSFFIHLTNLTYIDLHGNDIKIISPYQLLHLNQLDVIYLNQNKLKSWNKRILPNNDFQEIFVDRNKFTHITTAMLDDFKTTKTLILEGNPIICDCSFQGLIKWFEMNQMNVNFTDKNSFVAKCDSPENWSKQSIIEYLYFLTDNPQSCNIADYYTIIVIIVTIILIIIIIVLYIFRWYIRYWVFLSKLNLLKHNFWMFSTKLPDNFQYVYDAFVSYSIEDKEWVTQLCDELEPEIKLCIFERDFVPGSPISHTILQAVSTSKRTILVVSEAFAKSSWCQWETQLAQFHQLFFREDCTDGPDDTLILIKLEAIKSATPILKYLLRSRIYIDWPQEVAKRNKFWQRLKMSLNSAKGEIINCNINK